MAMEICTTTNGHVQSSKLCTVHFIQFLIITRDHRGNCHFALVMPMVNYHEARTISKFHGCIVINSLLNIHWGVLTHRATLELLLRICRVWSVAICVLTSLNVDVCTFLLSRWFIIE